MVKKLFCGLRMSGPILAGFIMLAASASSQITGQVLKIDRHPINMAAQDADGVVWGTDRTKTGGLYRWQGTGWVRVSAGIPQNGVPAGVWKGPDGGVVVVWQYVMLGQLFTWYRGNQSKQLGEIEGSLNDFRMFTTKPHDIWMTDKSPHIYHLGVGGKMQTVYTFRPDQFFPYTHPPGQPTFHCPFVFAPDGKGRVWIWGNALARYSNVAPLQGVLIYDGHSFEYHRTLPGMPNGGITFLGAADDGHLWVGIFRKGLYSVDTSTLIARRIPDPQPDAFDRVTEVFVADGATNVVTEPFVQAVAEPPGHRLTGILWQQRKGQWKDVLQGLDDLAEPVNDLMRPWLSTPSGLWLGSYGAGLWFVPAGQKPHHLFDWRRGFPLESVNVLYKVSDGKLLAIDLDSAYSVAFDAVSMRQTAADGDGLQVINPYSMLQQDAQFRMWGILSLQKPALDEWDGMKWSAHPLPGNLTPTWLSGLDADLKGHIWLFPGCQMGPIAVFDSSNGNWLSYPSYQEALEDQRSGPVEFLHAQQDRMKPFYGPRGQIAYMGACNGINYFDGKSWRLWNRQDVPGDPRYFFDGSAFFDAAGHLAVNIHHETWEMSPATGWRLIPYVPQQIPLGQWFMPKPPLAPPGGCPATQSTSLAHDRLGRAWWTWNGDVYVGIPGRCRQALSSDKPQPFIDGRLLRRVLLDSRGNTFFETLLANRRVGEYVFFPAEGKYPGTSLRVTQVSSDSVRASFSSAGGQNLLYTWRLDGGSWSTAQSQNFAVLQFLPSGPHLIEADAVDDQLRMNPVPASAQVNIGALPETQIAGLIEKLTNAPSDAEREAAVRALAVQPSSRVLPALQAARAKASANGRWWIDAAIQQIEHGSNQ